MFSLIGFFSFSIQIVNFYGNYYGKIHFKLFFTYFSMVLEYLNPGLSIMIVVDYNIGVYIFIIWLEIVVGIIQKTYLWKFMVVKASFKSPAIIMVLFRSSLDFELLTMSGKPSPSNTKASGNMSSAWQWVANTMYSIKNILNSTAQFEYI